MYEKGRVVITRPYRDCVCGHPQSDHKIDILKCFRCHEKTAASGRTSTMGGRDITHDQDCKQFQPERHWTHRGVLSHEAKNISTPMAYLELPDFGEYIIGGADAMRVLVEDLGEAIEACESLGQLGPRIE